MDLAFGRKFDNQIAAMTLGPNFNSLSVVVCLPLSRSLAVSLEISHTVSFSLCLSLSRSAPGTHEYRLLDPFLGFEQPLTAQVFLGIDLGSF